LANGAIKPIGSFHSKRLGLIRQPRSGFDLPVDGVSLMPIKRGGRKTPPHTHTPVVTCSRSDTNVTLETKTTSNDNPDIPVERVTPLPQGIDVQ
jgi:hypothetical protein